jgi:hypothetical protein
MNNLKITYTEVTKEKTYLQMLIKNLQENINKKINNKNSKKKEINSNDEPATKTKQKQLKKNINMCKKADAMMKLTQRQNKTDDKIQMQVTVDLNFIHPRTKLLSQQNKLILEAIEYNNRIYIEYLKDSIDLEFEFNKNLKNVNNNLKFKEAIKIYDDFKIQLNKLLNKYNDNKIRDSLFTSIHSETLNKSYIESVNNLSIKKKETVNSNTTIDYINKQNKNLKFYDEIIELQINFLDKIIGKENIYAVDGTNLAMSKKLVKNNYPYQRYTKLVDKDKINQINEHYKKILKEIKEKHDNKEGRFKRINRKDFAIIKEKELNETRKKRDKEIKDIKINIDDTVRKNNNNNKKGLYCRSLCTAIYNVNDLFPIALEESNNFANENNHIVEILNKIKLADGSTIIFDRKYYSKDLLVFLKEKNIIPLFRLDIDNLFVRKLNNENKNEIIEKVKEIDVKILKYTVDDHDFYMLTTNLNLTIEKAKELYHKRWTIEEYYKVQKHKMKGWYYNKNNKENYLGALKNQHIGYLFSRFMCILAEKFNIMLKAKRKNSKENKYARKVNFKEAMNISIENILYDTLNLNENDNLLFLLEKINKTRYSEVPNRKYKRKTILSRGRWDFEKS